MDPPDGGRVRPRQLKKRAETDRDDPGSDDAATAVDANDANDANDAANASDANEAANASGAVSGDANSRRVEPGDRVLFLHGKALRVFEGVVVRANVDRAFVHCPVADWSPCATRFANHKAVAAAAGPDGDGERDAGDAARALERSFRVPRRLPHTLALVRPGVGCLDAKCVGLWLRAGDRLRIVRQGAEVVERKVPTELARVTQVTMLEAQVCYDADDVRCWVPRDSLRVRALMERGPAPDPPPDDARWSRSAGADDSATHSAT